MYDVMQWCEAEVLIWQSNSVLYSRPEHFYVHELAC